MDENESGFYKLKDDVQQAFLFRDRVKSALFEGVRKDKYDSPETLPDDDAISFVEHLIDRYKHWERDHEFIQFALEVKQLLIDLVGRDISNDEAIAEIKQLQLTGDKDREIERLKNEYQQKLIENEKYVAKLIGDIRFANKVIARLVGE